MVTTHPFTSPPGRPATPGFRVPGWSRRAVMAVSTALPAVLNASAAAADSGAATGLMALSFPQPSPSLELSLGLSVLTLLGLGLAALARARSGGEPEWATADVATWTGSRSGKDPLRCAMAEGSAAGGGPTHPGLADLVGGSAATPASDPGSRSEADESLTERLREFAMLLASVHDAAIVVDLDGKVRFWNHGAEHLYGWSPAEASGQEAATLVFGGSQPMWRNLKATVLEEGVWDGELLQSHRTGLQLVVDARASVVRDGKGRPRSLLLVANDITERRQLERQLMRAQRLESLGTMACGIAHDLNNVLTPVQMVADLLQPAVAGTESQRFLDLLHRSARRGGDIIRQLLLFGRGGEGARSQMDLRFLVKEIGKILRETFPKSIHVQMDLPEGVWPVMGDVTQLHQVLLNLCVNARDAMPRGGNLTLSTRNVVVDEATARRVPHAKPGKFVVMEVADDGTGIPSEVVDRIFDPFFTTKPVGQGTGLGLASAMTIVRNHGGFIDVVTEMGAGTKFRVHLPVGAEAPAPEEALANAAPEEGAQELVLVVDDEDVIRELVRSALERAGYRVITAGDGAEAISIFGRRHGEISAVVIDMMMPFIDGAAAIAMFRRTKPGVAILAISGLPTQREEAEKAAGGQVSFLLKPFVVKDLVGELGRALQRAAERSGGAMEQ